MMVITLICEYGKGLTPGAPPPNNATAPSLVRELFHLQKSVQDTLPNAKALNSKMFLNAFVYLRTIRFWKQVFQVLQQLFGA